MTRKRIVITGSSGFVGEEILCRSDYLKHYDIRICDDIDSLKDLGNWATGATLLHLVGRFSGSREDLWESNVEVTKRALKYFSCSGGQRILFLSTGAVYGKSLHKDGSSEIDPVWPTNYYGYTKRVAEMVVEFEWGRDGKDWHILRLPNVYGQHQKKGVIYSMHKRLNEYQEVLIDGDGTQRRDFLHVTDLLRAIDMVLGSDAVSGIYNISSNLTLTINELVEIMLAGRSAKIKHGPDNNRLRELVLNISKAKEVLGFEPLVNQLQV